MFPDFLGIGAQKSGTTWLYNNLVSHPQIWMTPVKELHHLDHRPPNIIERLVSNKNHLRGARTHLVDSLIGAMKGREGNDLRWAMRYLFGRRTDTWYGTLFPELEGKITGEICPGYARVDDARVGQIHRLMPDAKIIYLIRNPVPRAWSAVAMHFRDNVVGGVDATTMAEVEARIRHKKARRHGDYLKNLAAWESCYPQDQILVGFFDDLQEAPDALLLRILDFLGLDTSEHVIPPNVSERRNAGRSESIPPQIERMLARDLIEEVRGLDKRFGNDHTRKWLAYSEERL
jgi:hypothetical protein